MNIAVVGCTGKLGSTIIRCAIGKENVVISHAIARPGNRFVGSDVSELIGEGMHLTVTDDIEAATSCDLFIDCTNADAFMRNNFSKYKICGKPLIIATTAFSDEDMAAIRELSTEFPIFISGNFSIVLHRFIVALRTFAVGVDADTDVRILEYHHNQKLDAPSGTAQMLRDVLMEASPHIRSVDISSVRVGKIFGTHEVVFANGENEVVTFSHRVSARETFAEGALSIADWLFGRKCGLYGMDDFCPEK